MNVQMQIRVNGQVVFTSLGSNILFAMPSLAQQRVGAAAVVLGGDKQLLVTGGYDGAHALSSVVDLLNLQLQQTIQWIAVTPIYQARDVSLQGKGCCCWWK